MLDSEEIIGQEIVHRETATARQGRDNQQSGIFLDEERIFRYYSGKELCSG